MVILLVGPAGSGKTTSGRRIAEHPKWVHVSEDDIWGEIGHPPHEARTEAEQRVVHARAEERICMSVGAGLNVVLEFLEYADPPVHLAAYQDFLRSRGIRFVTRVLRPSVETILERQRVRGRWTDRDGAGRRRQAERQVSCLHANLIDPDWVIDSSDETLDETYSLHFRHWVEAIDDHPPRGGEANQAQLRRVGPHDHGSAAPAAQLAAAPDGGRVAYEGNEGESSGRRR